MGPATVKGLVVKTGLVIGATNKEEVTVGGADKVVAVGTGRPEVEAKLIVDEAIIRLEAFHTFIGKYIIPS